MNQIKDTYSLMYTGKIYSCTPDFNFSLVDFFITIQKL